MTHLSELLLRAYVDGELEGDDLRRAEIHVASCSQCAAQKLAMEARRRVLSRALALLDVNPPARSAPTVTRPGERVGGRSRRAAVAAAVLIALGVAANNLPASPVRGWAPRAWQWVSAIFDEAEQPGPTETVLDRPTTDVNPEPIPVTEVEPVVELESGPADTEEAGLHIDAATQPVQIALHDLASGTEIEVAFVEGRQAGVFSSVGSRFRTGAGRLDVSVLGGRVRVEVPKVAGDVLLLADGEVLLVKNGDSLTVEGPVVERSAELIRFVIRH